MNLPKHKRIIELITNHSNLIPGITFQQIETPYFDDHIAHFDHYIDHLIVKHEKNTALIGFAYIVYDNDSIRTNYRLTFNSEPFYAHHINELVDELNKVISCFLPAPKTASISSIKKEIPIRENAGKLIKTAIESVLGKQCQYYNRKTPTGRRYEFINERHRAIPDELLALEDQLRMQGLTLSIQLHKNGYIFVTFEEDK
jgi:hypothetical protein